MKFTKEDAVKELTAKFSTKVEKIDKWSRTINENVQNLIALIGEDSEIELSDFVEKALPMLETTAGFLRKENSDLAKGLNEQIDALKKKTEGAANKDEGVEKSELEQMREKLDELIQERENEKKSNAAKEKRESIVKKIKEGGINDDEWIDAILSKTSIGEDADVESEATSYIEMYNKFFGKTPRVKKTPIEPDGSGDDALKSIISEASALAKSQRLI